jgi:hypothetical protein
MDTQVQKGLLQAVCTCPYGIHSTRRELRRRIAEFTGGSGIVKRRILRALSSGERDLLTEEGPKTAARTMCFTLGTYQVLDLRNLPRSGYIFYETTQVLPFSPNPDTLLDIS